VSSDPVLIAAGDLASCISSGDEATAQLVERLDGTVATLGDHAYDMGSAPQFEACYAPTWGRFKDRTRPAPGVHDYLTPGGADYFYYFGAAAGELGKGYYSYDLGAWHLLVLNSICWAAQGCAAGSAQEQWLRADLAAHPARCTLAYWHHPRFSSGLHGNFIPVQPFWQALYDNGAEVVLNAHDHLYERFTPQDSNGAADATRGLREFIVGTGGRSHSRFGSVIQPTSEVHNADTFGVLKLTLHPTSYDWEFIPAAGESFTDSGSAPCH